jgi:hypothetical protein
MKSAASLALKRGDFAREDKMLETAKMLVEIAVRAQMTIYDVAEKRRASGLFERRKLGTKRLSIRHTPCIETSPATCLIALATFVR